LLVLVVALVWLGFRAFQSTQPSSQPATTAAVRTARIATGPLNQQVRVSGQTVATNSASITVPIMRGPDTGRDMVLVFLAKAGSYVKKGDVVGQIDARVLQDHIDDVNSTVIQSETDIKKRQAEHAVDWENLQQTLRVAKADFEKAKLDDSAIETRSAIDQELSKLSVAEAEAKYKQLQQDLANKKAVHAAETRILEITRLRHIRHRNHHAGDLQKFTFRAPMDGLVVISSFFRGGEMAQIQQGDQVRPGMTFMQIVDISSMQVQGDVNQTESADVRVGQPAVIRLDAFPGVRLRGTVRSIGALGVRGWWENYHLRRIPVRIDIEESDPRVIPDLSASADIQVFRKDDAVLAPLEALRFSGSRARVAVRKGGSFEVRDVTLGPRNATHAVILSGLAAGEEVALEPSRG
jgi:biotin carboxyl carrier protein